MKRELFENELDEVTGGTVVLSAPTGLARFSGINRTFKMKGDIKQMRNLLLALYDAHEDMGDKEFDTLVMNEFAARGWI